MTSLSPSSVSLDEAIPRVTGGQRLRERGPAPTLADSEVLTMEVVGEYLGLVQDSALFAYFRQHYAHFFPAPSGLHRWPSSILQVLTRKPYDVMPIDCTWVTCLLVSETTSSTAKM